MYPHGIMSEIYGFGKGAVLSTACIAPGTIVFLALWLIGILACGICTPIFILLNYTFYVPNST
jgi:hypothetical protein